MTQWDITDKSALKSAVLETLKIASAESRESATVLALHGDLGAGKTTFVQTLAAELGVGETVTSPTFVIMKKYQTKDQRFHNLIHIDAYRVEDIDELKVLGFVEELSSKETIICVEWAEKIADLLPVATLHLHFSLTNEDKRSLSLK